MKIAEGPIYEISIEGGRLRCRVWRDAKIDEATGARCAQEMSEHLLAYATGSTGSCSGILFDVREAPPAFGPRTEASLRELFTTAAANGRRVAVLVSKAMQELQYTRLLNDLDEPLIVCSRSESEGMRFIAA